MPPNSQDPYTQPSAPQPAAPSQPQAYPQPKGGHGLVYGLLMLIILIAAVAGTYLWQNNKIKKLNTQLATANTKLAASASTPAATTTSQDYLYLYAYGAKIPLSNGIQDLYYTDTKQSGDDILDFSTQSLLNADNSCLAAPTGNVFSFTDSLGKNPGNVVGFGFGSVEVLNHAAAADQVGTTDTEIGTLVAHQAGYYYYYKTSQSPCASSTTNLALETQQEALFTTALKNLKPIN